MKEHVYDLAYQMEESHWWYVARCKIICAVVKRLVELRSEKNSFTPQILDYGCGTGAILAHLNQFGDAYGLDMSPLAIDFCKQRGIERVKCISQADISSGENPFPKPFDLLTMFDVIEHIPNEVDVIRSLVGWVRPGGHIVVTVPAFNFLWSGEDYVSKHIRRYTAGRLRTVMQESGISVEACHYFNSLLFPAQLLHVLFSRALRPQFMYESLIKPTPNWQNSILEAVFAAEVFTAPYVGLPFGGSIICWGKRLI